MPLSPLTLHICSTLLLGVALTLLPARASGQTAPETRALFESDYDPGDLVSMGGYGNDYIIGMSATYTHQGRFEEERPRDGQEAQPSGNTYGVLFEVASLPFRTIFGAKGGIEGSLGLGVPMFRSYFGGLRGHLGVVLVPIPLGPLDVSIAAGAAIGGHRHLYLKPQANLRFGQAFSLSASYKWNPPKASRVWDEGGPPGEYGVQEERLRGQLWIQLREPEDELVLRAVHIYGERTTITAPDPEVLEQKRVIEGTYWGGGIGASF